MFVGFAEQMDSQKVRLVVQRTPVVVSYISTRSEMVHCDFVRQHLHLSIGFCFFVKSQLDDFKISEIKR